MLNPEDEWVSLPNTIPAYLSGEYKTLLTYEKYGLGTDNFRSYELRRVSYEGKTYFLLLKRYRDGYYKYETIEEDWREYESFLAYVFTQEGLNKIKKAVDGKVNKIQIDVIGVVEVRWSDESEALDVITSKIDWTDRSENDKRLIMHIAPYKQKNLVQFQIYSSYSRFNIIGGIANEYKKGTKQVYGTDELFEHCYYEVEYNDFIKLFKLE